MVKRCLRPFRRRKTGEYFVLSPGHDDDYLGLHSANVSAISSYFLPMSSKINTDSFWNASLSRVLARIVSTSTRSNMPISWTKKSLSSCGRTDIRRILFFGMIYWNGVEKDMTILAHPGWKGGASGSTYQMRRRPCSSALKRNPGTYTR